MTYHLTKEKCKDVNQTEHITIAKELVNRLINDKKAVALAAPQIGYNVNMFTSNHRSMLGVYTNPKIIYKSKKQMYIEEGCRSLGDIIYPKVRSKVIVIKYLDLQGKTKIKRFSGLAACITQHEIDHLNGVMIND